MDFTSFESQETARMTVMHPETGEPIVDENGASPWIELSGTTSKTHRRAMFLLKRRIVQAMKDDGEEVTDDVVFERSEGAELDMLADLTMGWSGIHLDGQELKFTRDNARMFYERFPFVRAQVDMFVAQSGNFTKASNKN